MLFEMAGAVSAGSSMKNSYWIQLWLAILFCGLLEYSCVSSTPGAYWLKGREIAAGGAAIHLSYDPEGLVLPSLSVSTQVALTEDIRSGLSFSGIPVFLNNVEPFVSYSPQTDSPNRLAIYVKFPFYYGLENEGSENFIFLPTLSFGANLISQYEPGKSISAGIKFDPRLATMDLDSTAIDFLDIRKYGVNLALADQNAAGVAVNQIQYAFPSTLQYSFEYQMFLRK